jgi:CBS domain-containing protein
MQTLAAILDRKGHAVHTAPPEATVLHAIDRMCRTHIGALVVVEGDRPIGVFSERDLMTRVVLEQRDPGTTRVAEVMSTHLRSVDVGTRPQHVMELMTEWRVRHLPVLQGARLVGLVSIGDLLRWAAEERERIIDELERYSAGRYPG